MARFLEAHADTEELASAAPTLASMRSTMDSGRFLGLDPAAPASRPRGLPLWMAVKTLKGAWHADGSWPLIGCDEAERHRGVCAPDTCIVRTMRVSQHRHALVVPNRAYEEGKRAGWVLPCRRAVQDAPFLERSADAIALAYREQEPPPGEEGLGV
ncbi:hypothetical protein MSPP1_003756 [Malassezia sp. CBS 17886]|nr:hypothetical protein MSPP1_003756 [Malassezia sp. CBS 17886]